MTNNSPDSTIWTELLGASVRYYDADGVRTRCIECGDGYPLVLTHGMWSHAEIYMRNIVPLSRHFHVYSIDMLGHGLTDAPDLDYEVPDFARHLRAFMDAAGLDRAHIIGNSLGGWVAAQLTLEAPERVDRLILNCSASLKPTDEQFPDVPGLTRIFGLETEAINNPSTDTFVKAHSEFVYHLGEAPEIVQKLVREFATVSAAVYARPAAQKAAMTMLQQTIGNWNEDPSTSWGNERKFALTADRLASIKVPTLLLWGEHNPTMPARVADQAHSLIPDGYFHMVRECGHWPQLEKNEEFDRVVVDFLGAK